MSHVLLIISSVSVTIAYFLPQMLSEKHFSAAIIWNTKVFVASLL